MQDLNRSDLRCAGCKKFFHQKYVVASSCKHVFGACTHCVCRCLSIKIKNPPLPGDWSYLFYCKRCRLGNTNTETFHVQGKDNADVYIVVLYNLHLIAEMQRTSDVCKVHFFVVLQSDKSDKCDREKTNAFSHFCNESVYRKVLGSTTLLEGIPQGDSQGQYCRVDSLARRKNVS